jgi:hypothetical protein
MSAIWLAEFGMWLKPKAVIGCAGGCGCSTDANEPQNKEAIQTVKWR